VGGGWRRGRGYLDLEEVLGWPVELLEGLLACIRQGLHLEGWCRRCFGVDRSLARAVSGGCVCGAINHPGHNGPSTPGMSG